MDLLVAVMAPVIPALVVTVMILPVRKLRQRKS